MRKKKWIQMAKVKGSVPDGTFLKKAGEIVAIVLKEADGDKGLALRKILFYKNRAGKNLTNADEVNKAILILRRQM